MTEFARALQIDRGNQSAAQELRASQNAPNIAHVTTSAEPGGGAGVTPAGVEAQTLHQKRVRRDIESLDSPVELKPISTDPITMHMVEDSKVIYQGISKLAGLNVIFDPDYNSRRISVDLSNVSLTNALRIVGKLAGTFWSPLTENTIFVAQNNRAKHTDNDSLAVETFYLTNMSQQNDANEVVTALRNLLDPSTKVFLLASQNAIVIRATPAELVLVEKLIDDFDRIRPEVVVDVAVLEVSRDLERNLGITLPTSFSLSAQASNANSSSSSSSSTTSSSTSGLTLNTLANLNGTNFAVTLSSASVNALLSDSDTRVLQNPRVRASDGQQATLKIGSKIPVATGSTTSTLTSTATATTQFTYVDVGVNIDMTPTVHLDGQVSLKMKIEVSSQTGTTTISGVSEPIISQRVVQQVIQLKDGEPSILAGLLQQSDTKSVSGTPGLGEIPFLKYFFSSQDKKQSSDEIVFLLIPHIVRESPLTDANTRIIDSGTNQGIELRRRSPNGRLATNRDLGGDGATDLTVISQPTSAANAASAMIGQLAAQARPVAPALGDTGAAISKPSAASVIFNVVPSVANQAVGSTFQVAVMASHAADLFSAPFQLNFDPKVLSLVRVDSGELLGRDGQPAALMQRDGGSGAVSISVSRPPNAGGVTGDGSVVILTMKAIGPGDSTLTLTNLNATDSKHVSLSAVGTQAAVHVQ
ncbi:cohesin domain-containing protein [Terriglobus saanensis]|nr:cohesin domain-containing protein [Terriglobus saanensis]